MLQPGTQIGRYEIQRRLGRGGMGTVYVARDPFLARMVAIKVFQGDLDVHDASDRFAREARSAAALNHTNVVTVHDFGDYDGQPYIVMELIQGETIAGLIRRKAPVDMVTRVRWLEELAAGVAYAHREGIVHRDLKPTNLMVDRTSRLKVLDFGIARMLGTLSSTGTALIGTPGYMAPEQILGTAVDQRSDLFSMGVVAYELLSYTEAFPGETVPAITHRILSGEPQPLGVVCPSASPELVSLIEQALKKSSAERLSDASAFGEALRGIRGRLETAEGITVPFRPAQQDLAGDGKRGTPVGSGGLPGLTPRHAVGLTRDEIARRRSEQVQASLVRAEMLRESKQLDQALEECHQALTLDETHGPALELEKAIRAELTTSRAHAIVLDARVELDRGALTAADGLLEQARNLVADMPDVRALERDLRMARVELEQRRQRAQILRQTVDAAEQALAQSQLESALALAREALQLNPHDERANFVEREALRELDSDFAVTVLRPPPGEEREAHRENDRFPSDVGTVITRAQDPPPRARDTSLAGRPRQESFFAAGHRVVSAGWASGSQGLALAAGRVRQAAGVQAARLKSAWRIAPHAWKYAALAGAVLLIVGVALAVGTRNFVVPPVPDSRLVLEAVPWATVAAIEGDDGTPIPLPSQATTPLVVDVPSGSYRVRFVGPPPQSAEQVVVVEARVGSPRIVMAPAFATPTAEIYFEPYLALGAPVFEPAPSDPASQTDPQEAR